MIKKFFSSQYVICALFLMAGGFLSFVLKYDVKFDFANYHYYNAWAFLNDRVHYDIGVGGMNIYFNPLIEVPLYLLVKYFNDYPNFIYFVQGLWFGGLVFIFLKFLLLFFDWNKLNDKVAILLTLAIAVTGNALWGQIGSTTNEIQVSLFVLSGLYLLIKEIFYASKARNIYFLLSGFLLGMAMGLKLTAFIYCLSSGISIIIFFRYLQSPWRNLLFFILGGLVGFLLVNGFWMLKLWDLFENPFFPFANAIFKSDYMPLNNFRDINFVPQNWLEAFLWPLILSFRFNRSEGVNMFIADYRPAVAFVVLLVFIFRIFWRKTLKKPIEVKAPFVFLIVFEVISFILWMFIFSIVRYYIVIEMIAAIFIVKSIWHFKTKSFWGEIFYYTSIIIITFLLVSTPYFSDIWGRRYIGDKISNEKFLYVEDINIPDNTLLQIYNYPSSVFVALFADKAKGLRAVVLEQQMYRHITFDGNNENIFDVGDWKKIRSDIIHNHKGPKFTLISFWKGSILNFKTHSILSKNSCRLLKQNVVNKLMLCVPPEYADFVWKNEEKNVK